MEEQESQLTDNARGFVSVVRSIVRILRKQSRVRTVGKQLPGEPGMQETSKHHNPSDDEERALLHRAVTVFEGNREIVPGVNVPEAVPTGVRSAKILGHAYWLFTIVETEYTGQKLSVKLIHYVSLLWNKILISFFQ